MTETGPKTEEDKSPEADSRALDDRTESQAPLSNFLSEEFNDLAGAVLIPASSFAYETLVCNRSALRYIARIAFIRGYEEALKTINEMKEGDN